jgi:hypothetical protein
MTMNLPKHSMPSRPGALAQLKDASIRDKAVPASGGQAAQIGKNDQSSYEAAISEGWPVSPYSQHERGTARGYSVSRRPPGRCRKDELPHQIPAQGDLR